LSGSYISVQGGTNVQHSGVVDVHGLLRVGSAVLVVEVDAGIVDKDIDATVLRDFFGKAFDTAAVGDIQLRVDDATSGMV